MFDKQRSSTVVDRQTELPAGVDEMTPGVELAALLQEIDVTELSGHDQVVVLRAHRRLMSHFQAEVYRDMAAIAGTVEEEADGDPELGFDAAAAAEIGCALRLTRRAAEADLSLAVDLVQRLPRLWRALADGVVDARRVWVMVRGTAHLDQDTAHRVVDQVIEDAPRLTTGQLAARLRRLCIEIDPEEAQTRYAKTVQDRRLVTEASPDGTAHLLGLDLPPHRVAAIRRRINRLAKGLRRRGESRTMDQLRADVYLDLLMGLHQGTRNRGGVDIQVNLTTLLELSEEPGEVAGFGPVIADITRQVVGEQTDTQWRFTVTDPDTNQPVAGGITRRRPTAAQRRSVQTRNRTCVFPGCRMPAVDCDLDHRIPWAWGGATTTKQLAPLCRHHHILHHHTGWKHQPAPDGDHLWTSPLGHQYTTSGKPP